MQNKQIISVSTLNRLANSTLADTFNLVWVEGEVSNLSCPASGHRYFSLKDEQAQIRCALFRGFGAPPDLKNGLQVLVRAKVAIYEARGDFQLIVQHVEPAGLGALQRQFDALKKKLAAEGLFDPIHKQPIPSLPNRIGVITSSTGAALQDILKVLKRRFACIPVMLYPSLVQGENAAANLAAQIKAANAHNACDVLLLSRGGGSLEDLWPFNEECVVRAVFASQIPIISGVGHEVDTTIVDYVADVRAATPSAAAECVAPDQSEYQQRLQQLQARFTQAVQRQLNQAQLHIAQLDKRLKHPGQRIKENRERLQRAKQRLCYSMQQQLNQRKLYLQQLKKRLQPPTLKHYTELLAQQEQHVKRQLEKNLTARQEQLKRSAAKLQLLSPLNTLSRGYAILQTESGEVIRQPAQVKPGELVVARVADGELVLRKN